MRVGLVSPGYPPAGGGVEVVVAGLASALVGLGHQVEVLAAERNPALPRVSEHNGVLVRRFPSTNSANFPLAPALWGYLARHRHDFDVLHGHGYHTLAALGATLAAPGVRFVYSPHYHGTGHSPLRAALHTIYRPIGRIGMRRANAIVCVSTVESALVATHFPATRDRITVLPNAMDGSAIRAAAPFEAEPPTVLSVGRLEQYKRVDRLIEAFALVPPATQLVIIGTGPDQPRLTELAARSTAAPRIHFLGRVTDEVLRRWYRTARVVCGLSEHEAFGLTPAEAAAAGADVVLSDIPAHRELLTAGIRARLVAPTDNQTVLASILAEAVTNPAGQPPTVGILGWAEVASRLTRIYQGRTGQPHPVPAQPEPAP